MFCMRCGQDVPAAAEVCPACGQPTKLPEEPAAQTTGYGGAVPPPPPFQQAGFPPPGAAQSNLKGVAGFLLVFCICLIILWPLWTLVLFALHRIGLRPVGALGLLRTAFGIAVGVSLWKESRAALMLLRTYFVIAVALMAWSIFTFVGFLVRYPEGIHSNVFVSWLTSLLPYALFLVLGIAYFSKSERVRATYGEKLL